tara:strand:- start:231 stop:443 length:213 start_codon:yes stop_codon:yes gene_type:complete
MVVILFGLALIIISLLYDRRRKHTQTPCPTKTEYLPRTLDMLMADSEKVGDHFKGMFEHHIDGDNYTHEL